RAADVREFSSRAIVLIRSNGTFEASKTDRARRFEAMQRCGSISTPGSLWIAIDGTRPRSICLDPSRSGIRAGETSRTVVISRYGPSRNPQISGWAFTNRTEARRSVGIGDVTSRKDRRTGAVILPEG